MRFLHAPPPRLSNASTQTRARCAHASGVDAAQVRRAARAADCRSRRIAQARSLRRAPVLTGTGALTRKLIERVPFKLTRAQERVWREIAHDLKRASPMQRLLQGDVGSGKTIVAALAALQAIEIRQAGRVHGADRNPGRAALPQAGVVARGPRRAGSRGCRARCRRRSARARLRRLASGEAQFAIGTHALFQEGVEVCRSSASRSSTSSIASASRSALALRGKGLGRGAPADDERDADSAHARR